MRKGSKLLRLAFTRSDASTLYRALEAHKMQILHDESAPASVRAMEAADVGALQERIVKGIQKLGGVDAIALIKEPEPDAVAARHAKRVRSKAGVK